MRKIILVTTFGLLLSNVLYATEIYYKDGDLFIKHKGHDYIVCQYESVGDNDNRYYSTMYWANPDVKHYAKMHKGMVFIFDKEGNLTKMLRSPDLYSAQMILGILGLYMYRGGFQNLYRYKTQE